MKKLIHFVLICLLVLLAANIYAAETDRIESVVSTGIGVDAEGAKKNAICNAIEQVVGTYISSETMVKNNELITDQILSYSGGFVKESKILSQGKSVDGLYTVKIETQVVATKLKAKLQELNIATKKVDGGSLFGEAASRIQEQKSGTAILSDIFSKYPQAAYSFDVGKPEIVSTDPENNKAKVRIPVMIRFDEKYLNKLREVLHQTTTEELDGVELDNYVSNLDSMNLVKSKTGKANKITKDNKGICFARRSPLQSGLLDKCWSLSGTPINSTTRGNFLSGKMSIFDFRLNFSFKNSTGEIIDRIKYKFTGKPHDSTKKQGLQAGYSRDARKLAYILDKGISLPNILGTKDKVSVVIIDGTYVFDELLEIDLNVMNNISTVDVAFDSIK